MTPGEDARPQGRTPGIEDALLALIADAGLLDGLPVQPTAASLDAVPDPGTLVLDADHLRSLRSWLASDDDGAQGFRAAVIDLGHAAFNRAPTYVVEKVRPAPSGDPHDYVSLARYWWPDPATTDGLPYVRRDGEVNPDCYAPDFDGDRLAEFSDGVLALAVCGYLVDDATWLASAGTRLSAWLVDPATRQTPHFDHAQIVPGRSVLRPAVVVDARRMIVVAEAFRIVRATGLIAPRTEAMIVDWFTDLLRWLHDSPAARQAARARNNLAVWCVLERAVIADLVGDVTARTAALIAAGELVSDSVDEAGTVPAETVRANPADYTAFAFVAMAMLAAVGRRHGVPIWDRSVVDGRGLSATRAWLAVSGEGGSARVRSDSVAALALRLLAWRESAVIDAVSRAEALTVQVARRDGEIARLRAEVGDRRGGDRPARRSVAPAPIDPGRARSRRTDLRARSATWPIIGPAGRQALRLRRAYALNSVGRPPAAARPLAPEAEERLVAAYRRSPLAERPVTFVLYRILGNDLPPRHAAGQTLANLQFILHNEPDLVDCEKRWILNRIVDPDEEFAIVRLLQDHGHGFVRIPFDWQEYAAIAFELDRLPRPDFLLTARRDDGPDGLYSRAVGAAYRRKNLYAMNNNGARNLAIRDGRMRASWILPFDGSTYFTTGDWADLRRAVIDRPHVPYAVVPMARVGSNVDALSDRGGLDGDVGLRFDEEPQIAFRADAEELFDEEYPYGRRPKVELLWRLGVPGPWNRWQRDPWDPPFPARSKAFGQIHTAGRVLRLEAGGPVSNEHADERRSRGMARGTSILARLRMLDSQVAVRAAGRRPLSFYDDDLLERLADGALPPARAAVLAAAEIAVLRGPYSVVDKTTMPPSGDPHDYWNPAPYWWPNTSTADDRPSVLREGRPIPGSELFSIGSDRYDRTRLHLMFSDVTSLALAWRITGRADFARHAARLVLAWFVDEATAMNPHLEAAHVRPGHDDDRGGAAGVSEFAEIYYFLDAVRILDRADVLPIEALQDLRRWFQRYLEWVRTSPQGMQAAVATDHHGICYDLQVAAIAAFVGDGGEVSATWLRAQGRLAAQFDDAGAPSVDLARPNARHQCAFTLTTWGNLARILQTSDFDVWSGTASSNSAIARGIDWYLAKGADAGWPSSQATDFDARGDRALGLLADRIADPRADSAATPIVVECAEWVPHPTSGRAPFWPLALGPWPATLATAPDPASIREDPRT